MKLLKTLGQKLNIASQCRALEVSLWSCPQFLFLILGLIIIGSILMTYSVAQRFAEAEIVAIIVMLLTAFLFIVSYVIVAAFEKVVAARRTEARQARELLELKDQFVFIAAHELKTPANAIRDSMKKLEGIHQRIEDREKKIVDNIKESNERLLALVQDLLQVARLEGKTIRVGLSTVSVVKAYGDAAEELEEMKKHRGVEISTAIPADLPFVQADEMRFKEVLVNFLSNAIKYSDLKEGKVWVKAQNKDGEVVISVANNGPEIKPEDKHHVFQKFWRSKDAQKSQAEGTGLGLFIVKQLVEMMEGRTWFTTEPDRTTFFVALKKI